MNSVWRVRLSSCSGSGVTEIKFLGCVSGNIRQQSLLNLARHTCMELIAFHWAGNCRLGVAYVSYRVNCFTRISMGNYFCMKVTAKQEIGGVIDEPTVSNKPAVAR